MEYTNKQVLKDQENTENKVLAGAKDDITSILCVIQKFKFVDQVETRHLIDCIKKQSDIRDPNKTVDITLLVTEADDHSFFSDGTHIGDLRVKFVENSGVEFRDFHSGDERCFHSIPSIVIKGISRPELIGYAQKYMHKTLLKTVPSGAS
ncbi:hypothetical protein [Glaciimonas sp. PAMC28666]|uniref:hypothetical protein n=1 Tax=Glaciimonas sp. PAMC28666 TaxID=2807626 RepID=UPI001964A211|nr:hypothetical protein [Glaciimonas sp. PAMC28666]QRX80901.1 hypothetical protein JQN73_11750 [Glaciimonas sp. PAMC28666]